MQINYEWRGPVANDELEALHGEGFGHNPAEYDWNKQLRHSLGWVVARENTVLVGFVNVAWDGGGHAFVLDTLVAASARRRGIGRELVAIATKEARETGAEWLHVDFDEDLAGFYLDACGFTPAPAGLIALR